MKNFAKSVCSLAVTSLLSVSSGALVADSLDAVVNRALVQDPDVREVANRRLSRMGEVHQAKAGYLPKLDMNLGYGVEYTDSPGTRGNSGGHNTETLDRGEAGVVLTQTIFDGKATESEVERQQARVDSSTNQLNGVADDVSLATTKAYLDVLRHREILSLSEENLQNHQRIQDQIRLRSDAGVGRRADLDQINARVALVESNLIASRTNVEDAVTAFKRRVGEEPAAELDAVPELTVPGNVEEAIEMAMAQNPVLKQAGSDVEATLAQHKASYQNHYPYIYFEATGTFQNNLDGTAGHYNDATAMLKLKYNLYNGGRDVGRVTQTAYQIQEAQSIQSRSARQLEEEMRLAWAALQATQRQMDFLQQQVEFSISTREAYEKQFNIGQRTLLDLLNTDNELYDARVSLVNAKTDNLYAQYRIVAAMGKLTETLKVDLKDVLELAVSKDLINEGMVSPMRPDFLRIE
jgi:adhesin transport system outer membrane protein